MRYFIKPVGSVCYDRTSVFYNGETVEFSIEKILEGFGIDYTWENMYSMHNLPKIIEFEGNSFVAEIIYQAIIARFPYGFIIAS